MPNWAAGAWGPQCPNTITGRGTVMPQKPRPVEYATAFFRPPASAERGAEPAW
jgi:hypothetical protein